MLQISGKCKHLIKYLYNPKDMTMITVTVYKSNSEIVFSNV